MSTFKPEDFSLEPYNGKTIIEQFTIQANLKLQKLIDEAPNVVVKLKNIDGGISKTKYWCATQIQNNDETHTAKLMFIEEIVKDCKHQPTGLDIHYSYCKHCGVELKSKWEEVK